MDAWCKRAILNIQIKFVHSRLTIELHSISAMCRFIELVLKEKYTHCWIIRFYQHYILRSRSVLSYVAVSYFSHLKLIIMKKVYNLPAYGFCKEAIHLRVFYLVILFSRKFRIQIYMTNQLIIVYFSDTNTCLSDNRLLSWRRIICTTW